MNIKNRVLIIVSAIILVLTFSYLYDGLSHYNREIDLAVHAQDKIIDNVTKHIQRFVFNQYHNEIRNLVKDNPSISEAFARKDRQRLLELSVPLYKRYHEENKFFHAMDYNLPDGTVFLRVQKPELHGDNIAESRPIIAAVHEKKQQRSGYDIGKHGAIFWVAEPVFYDEQYIGAVEFGIEVKQLEEALSKSLESNVSSLLKANQWQKAELIEHGFQDFGDYVLMTRSGTPFDQISHALDFAHEDEIKVVIDGKEHVLHSCAYLKDFQGQSMGRLVLLQDISSHIDKKRKFVFHTLGLTLAMLGVSFLVLYYSFNKLIGRLEEYAANLKETQHELQEAHDVLEQRVEERTSELVETNATLKEEVQVRAKAEKKLNDQGRFLESIIESLIHPFYVIDAASYVVVLANKAACEHMGPDSYFGLTCHSLTHNSPQPCKGDDHPCPLREVKKSKKPVVVEHVHLDSEGNEHLFEINAYPIFDKYGEVAQIVEYAIDVTDRKHAEEEKEVLRSQLLASQKMEAVGILAGGVAHDFNNVLTTILGYSQIMALKLDEEDPMRDMVEEIYDAAERAAGLTRQLLAFSRKQVMELKIVNLNTIVENISKMLGRLIGEDIKLNIAMAEDVGNIKADVGQMEQVLMNLVVNARDAMPNGGKITVETGEVILDEKYAAVHTDVEPGLYAMLTVTDTGAGMSREIQEKIFEPFFTTKRRGKGTGLGLATVYGIVKQQKGHIYVYSEEGQGTTFKIYIPVVEGQEFVKQESDSRTMPQGTETIMIVDDDPSIRKLVWDTMEPLGYQLLEAGSGEDALALFERSGGKVDLVLSDLIMPGINGQELLEALREKDPSIRTIIMSGYTDNIVVQHGVLKPGVIFLNKPLLPISLAVKIRNVLDGLEDSVEDA